MRNFLIYLWLLWSFWSGCAIAQSLFSFDTSSGNQNKKNGSTSPPVLSPKEFRSQVQTMHQQTQNSLNQQITQQLSKAATKQQSATAPTQPTYTTPAATTPTAPQSADRKSVV